MKTIVLDIETKPSEKLIEIFTSRIKAPKTYKDADKIKAYIEEKKADLVKQMSTDVDFCDIKCIAIKIDEEPAKIVSLQEVIELLDEHTTVKAENTSEFQNRALSWRLITFNGKTFDLPVLIRQSLKTGLVAPYNWLKEATTKYRIYNHIDLMELINDREWKSLDLYAQIYLDEKKKEIDFETCSDDELKEHCLSDVEITYSLYKLFNKLI